MAHPSFPDVLRSPDLSTLVDHEGYNFFRNSSSIDAFSSNRVQKKSFMEDLVRLKGEQWVREMLDRLTKQSDGNGEPKPSA
jgi:hypothetical protein